MRRVLAVASLLLRGVRPRPGAPACRVRRRRRRSAPWTGPPRRACPRRRPAWIPTSCCANSSRPPPIRRTGTWPPVSSSPSRRRERWDDAGSALLIDRVVFVETRGARPGFGDHAGRHPRLAVRHGGVRDRRGRAARPRSDRTGQDPRRLAHRPAAQRGVPGLAAVPVDLQAQHAVLRRPDRQDRRARSALRRGVRSRPAGHRTGDQAGLRPAPRDGQHRAQPARPAAAAARSGHPRRRRQDRRRPRLRRRPHRPGEPVDHRPAQQATACRADHLDAVAGRASTART